MRRTLVIRSGGDENRTYCLLNAQDKTAWCVDPSYAGEAILEILHREGCRLTEVFLTHTHHDHVASVETLRKGRDARVWVHPAEAGRIERATPLPGEGPLAEVPGVEVLFTPGHTPGGTCYRIDKALFTGDTLFVDWVGRADLPGGDPRQLFYSLARLRSLPADLILHPGHHYGCQVTRSLKEELAFNKFFSCTDFEDFLALLPELAE